MRCLINIISIFFILTANTLANDNISKEKDCSWVNKSGTSCIEIVSKIPNSSKFSKNSINKIIISKKEIKDSGAIDIVDVLKSIPGINLTQSGSRGQQTSVFMRGANSNHTLVLINGIPINDHSTTQGLHDFGLDFIQTVQQIEVYPGSSGTHFGTNAIGGAINIVLAGDYKDKFNFGSDSDSNFDFLANKTLVNDNSSVNFKLGVVRNETVSTAADNDEKDGLKNYTGNINYEKWISPELKFFNTTYLRQTIAEYDTSASDNAEGDNRMLAQQVGLKNITNKYENSLVAYFNGYDREYDENGTIDNYKGNTSGLKLDFSQTLKEKISYGLGFDYKYDWGEFQNRGSYTQNTKGNSNNLATFGNLGLKIFDDTNISLFLRNDRHKQTGDNNTYKVDLNKIFGNLKIGAAHMTGLRNPTIYELYGTDNFGYSGNKNLNPEKSSTNEIYSNLFINENMDLIIRGFRTGIHEHIEYKSNRYVNSKGVDLVQNGIENQLNYTSKIVNLNFFSSFLSSKKIDGSDQARRPEKTYGINLSKKIDNNLLKGANLNLGYKHYGKHFDIHSTNFNTIEMDSTDIVNLNLSKKQGSTLLFLRINNLLNENFDRPHGFNQESRMIKFGIEY